MDGAIDRILDFWFAEGAGDPETRRSRSRQWFRRAPGFDAEIARQFAGEHALAARGALDDWTASARGSLALIIVLDQFSRNLFRATAAAFAQDDRALGHARAGIAAQQDRQLDPRHRAFFYLPFAHAEDLAVQDAGVTHFRRLVDDAPPEFEAEMERWLAHMRAHREIISRFGRFPHRNAALGRPSSRAEHHYLATQSGRYGQI